MSLQLARRRTAANDSRDNEYHFIKIPLTDISDCPLTVRRCIVANFSKEIDRAHKLPIFQLFPRIKRVYEKIISKIDHIRH